MCAHTFTGSAVCAWNTLFNNSCVSRSCHCWSSHCIIIIVVIEWMRSECWLISIALSAKTFKRATAAVAAPNAHQVEMLKSSASWLTVLLFFANAIVKMRIIAFWLSKSEMEAFRYFAQHTHTQKVTGVKVELNTDRVHHLYAFGYLWVCGSSSTHVPSSTSTSTILLYF